jgi:hypothetical protein
MYIPGVQYSIFVTGFFLFLMSSSKRNIILRGAPAHFTGVLAMVKIALPP